MLERLDRNINDIRRVFDGVRTYTRSYEMYCARRQQGERKSNIWLTALFLRQLP